MVLQGKNTTNGPEFRNYFYVYKNYTVDDEYKRILLEHYFTEVRSVEKPDLYDFGDSSGSKRSAAARKAELSSGRSANEPGPRQTVTHERIKRWAKRFLGIDLAVSHKPRTLSNVSAGRLHSDGGDVTGKK